MADPITNIIDAVIKAEGGAKATNDPSDKGGRTQFGISEASNPAAWADDVVTEEEARAIYQQRYVDGPGFSKLTDPRLLHFMVDWGVLSGPTVAIRNLQSILNLESDGILGPQTISAANASAQPKLRNRLVIERAKMVGRIVQKNPGQARFISGWLNRILEFFEV